MGGVEFDPPDLDPLKVYLDKLEGDRQNDFFQYVWRMHNDYPFYCGFGDNNCYNYMRTLGFVAGLVQWCGYSRCSEVYSEPPVWNGDMFDFGLWPLEYEELTGVMDLAVWDGPTQQAFWDNDLRGGGYPDSDGDGLSDLVDNCPHTPNSTYDASQNIYIQEPCARYVNKTAECGTACDGSSWEDAYTDLQDALDAAQAGQEIWVAEGTYKPSLKLDPADPRTATLEMIDGVKIYGGFPEPCVDDNPCNPGWEDRDPAAHATILSGEIGNLNSTDDNVYHVVYANGVGNQTVLDGFSIVSGRADDNVLAVVTDLDSGGGVYCKNSALTVENCTFQDNWASNIGGGMFVTGTVFPLVSRCTFVYNHAGYNGGGMANLGPSRVLDCKFVNNTADNGGGAMFNEGDYGDNKIEIFNTVFIDNYVFPYLANLGGAIANHMSSPKVINCTFYNNKAGYNPQIDTVNVVGLGHSMSNQNNSNPTVVNCIFWGQTPPDLVKWNLGEIHNVSPDSNPYVNYCDVQGGYLGNNPEWAVNIDADPLLQPDNIHLQAGSPCIDSGNWGPILAWTDIDGDTRVMDNEVDMGADEVSPPLVET